MFTNATHATDFDLMSRSTSVSSNVVPKSTPANDEGSSDRRLQLLHQVNIFDHCHLCVYEQGEETHGEGEVGREVVRRQKELCKLLFDTRFSLCIALLSVVLLGMNIWQVSRESIPT